MTMPFIKNIPIKTHFVALSLLLSFTTFGLQAEMTTSDHIDVLTHQTVNDRQEDRINQQQNQQRVFTQQYAALLEHIRRKNVAELTSDELIFSLNEAINYENIPVIKQILPYLNPQKQRYLIRTANAVIALHQKKTGEAIAIFEQLNAQRSVPLIQYKLLRAYYLNKQYHDAQQLLKQMNPQTIPPVLQREIQYIDQRTTLPIDASFDFHFFHDKNINNTSKDTRVAIRNNAAITEYHKSADAQPQSSYGLQYQFSADKEWNVAGNYYLGISGYAAGKHYFSHHDYDDLFFQTDLAAAYKNRQSTLRYATFFPYQLVGNEYYYKGIGQDISYRYQINDQHSIRPQFSWQRRFYREDSNILNGNHYNASLGYYFTQNNLVIGGRLGYIKEQTQSDSYSNHAPYIQLFYQDALYGQVAFRLKAHYQITTYRAARKIEIPMFGQGEFDVRKDKTLKTTLSLWHNEFKLFNLIPTLNFTYEKRKSTIDALYSYSQFSAYINFSKSF